VVVFNIVKNSKYGEKDENKLILDIHKYMGQSFKIELKYVDKIPRERNGKFRQIVSEVFKDKLRDDLEKRGDGST
jgi:phenylacetate-coenzyme A ligase PaaK-like adenylate-forming protein